MPDRTNMALGPKPLTLEPVEQQPPGPTSHDADPDFKDLLQSDSLKHIPGTAAGLLGCRG